MIRRENVDAGYSLSQLRKGSKKRFRSERFFAAGAHQYSSLPSNRTDKVERSGSSKKGRGMIPSRTICQLIPREALPPSQKASHQHKPNEIAAWYIDSSQKKR